MPLATRFRFDRSRASIGDWARAYSAELVKGIDETTRMWLREMIASAFEEERDLDELADDIYSLLDDEDRAEKIARTETIRAAVRGQQEAWAQAVEEGFLTGEELQEWIVTPDDRLCPLCEQLDGEQRPFGESFVVNDIEVDGPPLHPNCRCAIGISAPAVQVKKRAAEARILARFRPVTRAEVYRVAGGAGSGNFGHAGRPGQVGGSSLSSADHAVVTEYVGSSVRLNDNLRGVFGATLSASEKKQIKALDKVMKLHPVPDVVYRAAPASLFGKGSWDTGALIKDPGYLSTTTSLKAAKAFRVELDEARGQKHVILEITVPKGTRGLDINEALGSESQYPEQQEIVLARGAKLRLDAQESRGIVKMTLEK